MVRFHAGQKLLYSLGVVSCTSSGVQAPFRKCFLICFRARARGGSKLWHRESRVFFLPVTFFLNSRLEHDSKDCPAAKQAKAEKAKAEEVAEKALADEIMAAESL